MSKDTPEGDRIAKVLSRAGIASRRDAERMITEGRVKLNGRPVTSPALNVGPADRITVDGRPVAAPEPTRLWLFHKPAGLVTSESDELGRATVFEELPPGMPRVMSVGRLDLTSEGLLLLTNDGELKRRLELPATGWLRRYRVRINGSVSEVQLQELRKGITVEGIDYQPMEVSFDRQQGANAWLTIAIREGKNREIRRVMEALGVTVNRLIRVSYGPFQLGDLAPGAVSEVARKVLRDQLGDDQDEDDAKPARSRKPGSTTTAHTKTKKPRPEGPIMRSTKGPRPGEDTPRPRPKATAEERPARTFKPRAEGDAPRAPYKPRAADGERKPYSPRADGDYPRKPYGPRTDGDAPRGPSKPRAEGERPASGYKPRAADGDRPARAYKPREDGDRPARPQTSRGPKPAGDGAGRPYAPKSHGYKSHKPRTEGDAPRKPYGPRAEGDAPRKPYASRADGAGRHKSYGPRTDGDGPRKPHGPRAESDAPRKAYGSRTEGDAARKPHTPRGDGARRNGPPKGAPRGPRKGPEKS
ncbi:MAG: pseudouridine synthase [Rhodobacterales bacterium]|nr:pseudouridine synthase [Rhodobacterales bacterium]